VIRFACPACRAVLRCPDDKARATVPCAKCGQAIIVPDSPRPKSNPLPGIPLPDEDVLPPPKAPRDDRRVVKCPGCGRTIPVGDDEWGVTIECSQCDTQFTASAANRVWLPRDGAPPEPEPKETLPPHRGTLVLILGILSLVTCPMIFGPLAWLLGHLDVKAMREGRMDSAGLTHTNTGRICGMLGTLLFVVGSVASCGVYTYTVRKAQKMMEGLHQQLQPFNLPEELR
jgi:hypothetical protein